MAVIFKKNTKGGGKMIPAWKWFVFFLPIWSSIVISYLFYKRANF